jgi:nucleotide-binding universal stress UspA family protein
MTAKIVLGIDDDEQVDALVEFTAHVAFERSAPVVVVHVVHRSEIWALASLMVDSTSYLRARRRRFERHALTPLRARGVDARFVLRLGEPAHELARVAAVVGADDIVIGAESHARKHHLVGGGVAHRLEQLTAVPVEVVEHAVENAGGGRQR